MMYLKLTKPPIRPGELVPDIKMKVGYYWFREEGEPWHIIEIGDSGDAREGRKESDSLYFCGGEEQTRLWQVTGEFIGPLIPMTEQRALEILGEEVTTVGLGTRFSKLDWMSWNPKDGAKDICLDGGFSADQLEALVWWMRNKGK